MHMLNHKRVTIAICVLSIFAAVAFGVSIRKTTYRHPAFDRTELQKLDNAPDQSLRVLENEDSPLRILDAKVKEISGPDFTKLTGKKTSLLTVCSVPETRLLNSSGKVVSGFVLVVRDPTSKTTRGMVQSKVSIAQGETYTAQRDLFVRPEFMTNADETGQVKTRFGRPELNSEHYWISFGQRSDLFVTVAKVNFQDGTIWTLKEGGDIR